MVTINSVAPSTTVSAAAPVDAQNTQSDFNAFLIILNAYLQDIKNQDSGVSCGLANELAMNGYFKQAQEKVKEAQANLDKVNNDNKATAGDVQAALMQLQAAQTQAGFLQNNMNQLFKSQIDPNQTMIQQDCGIAGKAMQLLVRTERTFA